MRTKREYPHLHCTYSGDIRIQHFEKMAENWPGREDSNLRSPPASTAQDNAIIFSQDCSISVYFCQKKRLPWHILFVCPLVLFRWTPKALVRIAIWIVIQRNYDQARSSNIENCGGANSNPHGPPFRRSATWWSRAPWSISWVQSIGERSWRDRSRVYSRREMVAGAATGNRFYIYHCFGLDGSLV